MCIVLSVLCEKTPLWGEKYFQLIFSVRKIRPSLTTSKDGLRKYNIHLETTRT